MGLEPVKSEEQNAYEQGWNTGYWAAQRLENHASLEHIANLAYWDGYYAFFDHENPYAMQNNPFADALPVHAYPKAEVESVEPTHRVGYAEQLGNYHGDRSYQAELYSKLYNAGINAARLEADDPAENPEENFHREWGSTEDKAKKIIHDENSMFFDHALEYIAENEVLLNKDDKSTIARRLGEIIKYGEEDEKTKAKEILEDFGIETKKDDNNSLESASHKPEMQASFASAQDHIAVNDPRLSDFIFALKENEDLQYWTGPNPADDPDNVHAKLRDYMQELSNYYPTTEIAKAFAHKIHEDVGMPFYTALDLTITHMDDAKLKILPTQRDKLIVEQALNNLPTDLFSTHDKMDIAANVVDHLQEIGLQTYTPRESAQAVYKHFQNTDLDFNKEELATLIHSYGLYDSNTAQYLPEPLSP